ncbi:acyl-ACP--UDP-N-acetylglucosamine O-acyltransferase [Ponticaulis profundi]|uniref:Acyl-ACP--UDP-N-acetylglucosamine O-acyltransferase n=1 Tax=Ponticaulis profundi TaxID=2665222 RepID=A0ABW1SEI9_9PROT
MAQIHPTALIEDGAQIAETAEIGPFCMVGPQVTIGANTKLRANVIVTGDTTIGADCEFFPFSVIGERGQILGNKDVPHRVEIGDRNVFREHVTVHGASPDKSHPTRIGNDCYFMATSHIGHDCLISDKCVLANNTAIGGETHLGFQVWTGGGALIHQKSWIGDHAFVAGGAVLVGDVPPFAMASGQPAGIASVNMTGLQRRGFNKQDVRHIHRSVMHLFAGKGTFAERLAALREKPSDPHIDAVLAFIDSERGGRPLCGARKG